MRTPMYNALKSLKTPKSLINRTQQRDLVDSFVSKTYDKKTICLDVYENEQGKWYVVSTNAFSGWTHSATDAFLIFKDSFVYTLKELTGVLS